MWTKLKALLAAAAALVAIGVAVPRALRQAGQEQGATCGQWASMVERVSDEQAQRSFYLAITEGAEIPKSAGTYLLGDCGGGSCSYLPEGCDAGYTYSYTKGPLRNGWRIYEVRAHPYVARGWKQAASDSGGTIRWYGTKADVVTACLAHFAGGDCLAMLGGASNGCWLLDTGDICRDGYVVRVHGPGDAEPQACPAARIIAPFPCTVNRGVGSEWQEVQETFTDEEMEAAE